MVNNFICPWNPAWATSFAELKSRLRDILAGFEIEIEHVGSTAIPHLPAKPILDIDIILFQERELKEITKALQEVGYLDKGEQGVPGRYAFRQGSEKVPLGHMVHHWQEHHLYVCAADSLALKNHLLFRNALLQNALLAAAYARLKMQLIQKPGMTRQQYAIGKTDFILSVLKNCGLNDAALNEIREANK